MTRSLPARACRDGSHRASQYPGRACISSRRFISIARGGARPSEPVTAQSIPGYHQGLIRRSGRDGTVMPDLPVDFDALLTHGTRLDVAQADSIGRLLSYDGGRAILFKQLRIIGTYFAGFGTKQPSRISWVTAPAGIELTILGPLQSSTPWRCARFLAFAMASSSLAHISGSNPVR
jgi:hypothetical protein